MPEPTDLYLQLMKSCLTNAIYGGAIPRRPRADARWKRLVVKALRARELELVQARRAADTPAGGDDGGRLDGRAWLPQAHTMIGLRRLDNLQECIEDVLERGVPGDVIEAGVWRGGASIFMRAVLKAHQVEDRVVWVADSFQGLPPPNIAEYPADAGDLHHTIEELAVSLDDVRRNFRLYELLDDQVRFLPGWFRETLPQAPIEQLAVIRIDADMYESTTQVLEALYPKLAPGGYVIVDDYGGIPGCRRAVDDYRTAMGITDEIQRIDWTGIFWLRSCDTASGELRASTRHAS